MADSPKRWTCRLCGRSSFTRPGQPHRCVGGLRKRFSQAARQHGWDNCWVETKLLNDDIRDLHDSEYVAELRDRDGA